MTIESKQCDDARIARFLRHEIQAAERLEFVQHLDGCADCSARLESETAGQAWWQAVNRFLPDGPCEFEPLSGESNPTGPASKSLIAQQVLDHLAPTDDPKMLGRIGSYEIAGVVGAGGMGVVLKGFDLALDRFVAIKTLSPTLAASGSARKRFSREARAAAVVVHDNVIEIYGVSEANGLPYLVMPYTRGVSLQKRLDESGPMSTLEVLRVAMQAAAGLAAAHAQGLVHRDVKPANILLADGIERVKLTDFGLARAADDASLTKTGVIAGTPQFMSPEQARGDRVDHRSDLFSLGSVMYAMCTGRPPFRADTSYGILRRITDTEPRPVREINPDIPDWLCEIIAKLMSKQPEHRFASASEVAELLEECLAHVQQPDVVPHPAHEPLALSTSGKRGNTPVAKLLVGAAFAFAMIFAGILIVLELNKGTLTIECEVDDVSVRIMQGEEVVEKMAVTKSGATVHIAAGAYVVELDGEPDRLTVQGGTVRLERGGQEIARIVQRSDKPSNRNRPESGDDERADTVGTDARSNTQFLIDALEAATQSSPTLNIDSMKLDKLSDGLWIDKEHKRVVIDAEVCLREGSLEMLACPAGSKEHESVVAIVPRASFVHTALLAVGGESGRPVQFWPAYSPASGDRIDVFLLWDEKDGTKRQVAGQHWVRNKETRKAMEWHWVFAGSGFSTDESSGKRHYHGDAGDFICVSNFATATMDIPVESTHQNAGLLFEAFTENIPPLGTKVKMVLVPVKVKDADTSAAETEAAATTLSQDGARWRGSWKVVRTEHRGKVIMPGLAGQISTPIEMNVRGEKINVVWSNGGKTNGEVILGSTKSPREFKFAWLIPMRGVYKFDGDRLTICYNPSGSPKAETRPADFQTTRDADRVLCVFERQPPIN
jgi:uncharacterized protein (TIGR03067 family)